MVARVLCGRINAQSVLEATMNGCLKDKICRPNKRPVRLTGRLSCFECYQSNGGLNTAQQIIDAGFAAGLGIDFFDDDGAVQAVTAIFAWDGTRYHH